MFINTFQQQFKAIILNKLRETTVRVTYFIGMHPYETAEGWVAHHSVGEYRAIGIEEIADLTIQAGFRYVKILKPADTGFYQPIISGTA